MNDDAEPLSEDGVITNFIPYDGFKPADVVRVAGLIGDQARGRISGTEMLGQIRAYFEADIREQVAGEIRVIHSPTPHYRQPRPDICKTCRTVYPCATVAVISPGDGGAE